MPPPPCAAILVAAGTSVRMGFDKLAAPLAGMPVLRRTLDAFLAAPSVAAIVVVCPASRWQLLDPSHFSKPVTRVDGGSSRQESVALGLAAVPDSFPLIAVHDGARPLVSPEDIERTIAAAAECRAAALARKATETMKRSDAGGFCLADVSRDNLWCMETPQVFASEALRHACRTVGEQGLVVTDEVSAVSATGLKTRFVESRFPNPKITTPADLALAEALLDRSS